MTWRDESTRWVARGIPLRACQIVVSELSAEKAPKLDGRPRATISALSLQAVTFSTDVLTAPEPSHPPVFAILFRSPRPFDDWENNAVNVLDLIRKRAEAGSEPGARTDPYRLALAVEGGGSRGAYSIGMVVELEKRGLTRVFDELYGSSMGAINVIWLISGQASHGVSFFGHPAVMPRVIRPRAFLCRKPVVDLQFLTDEVYQRWAGLDFDAVLTSPIGLHPIATDADSGAPIDLGPFLTDAESVKMAMRGSAGMPLLTGPLVELGGHRVLDGGLAEAIPYRSALRDGATHVLVLRTRRADEVASPPSRGEDFAVRVFLRRVAPAAVEAWSSRSRRRAADDVLLANGSRELCQVLVPPGSPEVSRLATDGALIQRAIELGSASMADALR